MYMLVRLDAEIRAFCGVLTTEEAGGLEKRPRSYVTSKPYVNITLFAYL